VGDLLYVLIMVAFFALAAGFVVACDRIIGSTGPYDARQAEAPAPPDGEADQKAPERQQVVA